jgi:transposase
MTHYYEPEFKQKMVRLHLEEGRTLVSLQNEYKVSKAAISHWVKDFRTECQTAPQAKENYDFMKENLRLKKELEEVKKENLFLKKAAAFFAKEID